MHKYPYYISETEHTTMGTFDIRQDAPGILRAESLNIAIRFDKTGPTTGRVSWNIPSPAAGCLAGSQAYCGMLVTLDTTPATSTKIPTNGTVYSSDATADGNLHAGDKLGTALVVGAFYTDRTTTFFDVENLAPNTAYYVSGFPMDCEFRYFQSGVHAYSLDFNTEKTQIHNDTTGKIVVELNSSSSPSGVALSDQTGLVATVQYQFDIQLGLIPAPRTPIDATQCIPETPTHTITINGSKAGTYQELINEINVQLSLIDNPFKSPLPPNTGGLYFNNTTNQLFQWDGFTNTEIPIIISTTQPNLLVIGDWWFNPSNQQLSHWDGLIWVNTSYITFSSEPNTPACNAIWFNGTTAYTWNGNVWCTTVTYIQPSDPSIVIDPPCGSYWYNTSSEILFSWNNDIGIWSQTTALQYGEDPSALPVGTYWFNSTNNTLQILDNPTPGWNVITNITISENPPTIPSPGKYWYNPATMELFQRDITNTTWDPLAVLVFSTDPQVRVDCELWWDTDTDELFVWDTINNVWAPVTSFVIQATDPNTPPTIIDGTVWYDSDDNVFYVWDDGCFKVSEYINLATDPTAIASGTIWFNTTTDKWFEFDGAVWNEIIPTTTNLDPSGLPANTYWYNPTTPTLQVWNGVAWIVLMFSTQPLAPTLNTLWFDDTESILKIWNGSSWITATPRATVEHDCLGNLLFTDTNPGSLSYVRIADKTLFQSLQIPFTIHLSDPGTDGVSTEPSYAQLGIGTDGSNDERLKLMNEIRYELGYPTVDVELTPEQIDFCITKALEELRSRTSVAYKHGFFFMRVGAETQRYLLTNKTQEMDKIVTILGIYRLTSSFLSSAHGAGVYGQIVLQHLYNMGTFDLLSYHLISEYTELMEILFAGRITFSWNEQKRELWIHHRFPFSERMVLIEATIERTEQDIITDRWCRSWIRKYATACGKYQLAEIRGKYSSLPGAGGSVSLNASDLRQSADMTIEKCIEDIDNYVVDNPDMLGLGTQMVLG